jgi:enoyl-CoA hydratase
MTSTRISLDVAAGVAWITLDGPERRNALDAAAARALVEACDAVDADPSVGAAVVTGAGGAFCSGADTAVLDHARASAPDAAYESLGELYSGFLRVAGLGVPTVAAVDGAAVGAGLNLALATDLRIATPAAVFVSGFAPVGLHPGGGHLHLLARAAGPAAAAALGVFGRRLRADAALACGLVADVVEPAALRDAVRTATAHLAADPALARALKASLRRTVHDVAAHDRAVEVERARQLWSLSRTSPQPSKES